MCFDLIRHGAAVARGVGTLDEKEVWKTGSREPEVRYWVWIPGGAEVGVVGDDGEGWDHVDVGAGGADHGVDFSLGAVGCDDSVGGEVGDWVADEGDVVFCQCFEVAGSRGQAAAVGREVWDDVLEEFWFFGETVGHQLDEISAQLFVLFCAFEDCSKPFVEF